MNENTPPTVLRTEREVYFHAIHETLDGANMAVDAVKRTIAAVRVAVINIEQSLVRQDLADQAAIYGTGLALVEREGPIPTATEVEQDQHDQARRAAFDPGALLRPGIERVGAMLARAEQTEALDALAGVDRGGAPLPPPRPNTPEEARQYLANTLAEDAAAEIAEMLDDAQKEDRLHREPVAPVEYVDIVGGSRPDTLGPEMNPELDTMLDEALQLGTDYPMPVSRDTEVDPEDGIYVVGSAHEDSPAYNKPLTYHGYSTGDIDAVPVPAHPLDERWNPEEQEPLEPGHAEPDAEPEPDAAA